MWRGKPQHTASGMESSTGGDRMMCPCAASLGSKGRNCWRIYTVETVGIIHHHGPSLARRSAADSISPLRSMMSSNW